MRAKVKWFSKVKGYGFLKTDHHQGDIMIHQSAIDMEGYRFLKANQEVEVAALEVTPQGFRASKVFVDLDKPE